MDAIDGFLQQYQNLYVYIKPDFSLTAHFNDGGFRESSYFSEDALDELKKNAGTFTDKSMVDWLKHRPKETVTEFASWEDLCTHLKAKKMFGVIIIFHGAGDTKSGEWTRIEYA